MVPEDKLQEFVKRVREAAGANVEAVVLYGSAAAGEYDPEFSNLNVFCILRDASFDKLTSLSPAMKWWHEQKQPAPLLMTRAELESTTDVFTIELMDMQQHHRVLLGEDIVSGLQIPMRFHRVQLEYELREKVVLLRQRALLAAGDDKRLWELMVRSAPSFVTLFRHALLALGEEAPATKRVALQKLASKVGFDPGPVQQVLDVREHKTDPKKIEVRGLFARYLEAVEKVTQAVDRALDPVG